MEQLDKNNILVWVGAGVVAAILVIVLVFGGLTSKSPSSTSQGSSPETSTETSSEPIQTPQGEATVVAPGASAITDDGVVVAPSGNVAKNDSTAMASDLPTQSAPINNSDVPSGSVKLNFSNGVFSPQSFAVSKDDTVVLAITSDKDEIFRFDEAGLRGIVMDVRAGETRLIPFTVSVPVGTYNLRAQIKNIEVVMTVK